jgi:hypothetical protein
MYPDAPNPRACIRIGLTPLRARYARTAAARAIESRRFIGRLPVESVYPAISIRISGFATSEAAT